MKLVFPFLLLKAVFLNILYKSVKSDPSLHRVKVRVCCLSINDSRKRNDFMFFSMPDLFRVDGAFGFVTDTGCVFNINNNLCNYALITCSFDKQMYKQTKKPMQNKQTKNTINKMKQNKQKTNKRKRTDTTQINAYNLSHKARFHIEVSTWRCFCCY